jgi:hypothetical protein
MDEPSHRGDATVQMAGGPVYVQPNHEPYEAERREQQLVLAYFQFLREKGLHVTRHLIRPEGEAKPASGWAYLGDLPSEVRWELAALGLPWSPTWPAPRPASSQARS